MTTTPSRIPLPLSPIPDYGRRSSVASIAQTVSPTLRPRLERKSTSLTVRQNGEQDPFLEGSKISVNQPVGSLSISPSSRDICLASRKGLYILDLANLNNAPRFIPQGGTWQIADCQWSPHPATSNLILSTSSQKLLVWDLAAPKSLHSSMDAHSRAITDINWHAHNPNLMATVSMDAGIRGWDLRTGNEPFMRLCAWGQAGTQVKWNRQHENVLATAHGKEVIIWDSRKGSVPIVSIRAHDSKIYGIDWDRQYRHKLVTCSLDKTIKYWSIPELAEASSESSTPTNVHKITTNYPVWRARNLPFGRGVLSLPQRGEAALEMFGLGSAEPVERFEGHDDVVKEFVWRTKGGTAQGYDDREFQLVTWAKDRTLRIWPVTLDMTEKVGRRFGEPIKVLQPRRGAPDVTYTKPPDSVDQTFLPPPIVNPSGISRQRIAKTETGMTRGGGSTRGMDQLEWLTKVVKNRSSPKPSPDSSVIHSRVRSPSRRGSRGESAEDKADKEYVSLTDEVVLVHRIFPRPRVNFEKIDLHHRRVTMSMNGPWANGDRMAFLRIHWSFPPKYPFSPEPPTFQLERNPTVSPITRQKLVSTIREMRAMNRQCLVATSAFLLGSSDRPGLRLVEEESDTESENNVQLSNVPMLIRTCGATFGPNGQLVCFFPKQTILPRTKHVSKSLGVLNGPSPLSRAMSALLRMDNPRQRRVPRHRLSPIRRLENVPTPVQAGSTVSIHDVTSFGGPDLALARLYGSSTSPSLNLLKAMEFKRLDHAEAWATLSAILSDPPPPYSVHPSLDDRNDLDRERVTWEQDLARKRTVLDQLLAPLIAARDVQLLTMIGCAILDYLKLHPPPPTIDSVIQMSPESDYFGLPRLFSTNSTTPVRRRTRASLTPVSPGNSGRAWSQILNTSGTSLKNLTTPTHPSASDQTPKTPLGVSFEESNLERSIPVPARRGGSPRRRERTRSGAGFPSLSPSGLTPLKSSRSTGRDDDDSRLSVHATSGTSTGTHAQSLSSGKVTFGSASPSKVTGRTTLSGSSGTKRSTRVCTVSFETMGLPQESADLLDETSRAIFEGCKLAYGDFLLRNGLLGYRARLMQYGFGDGKVKQEIEGQVGGVIELPSDRKFVCAACASQSKDCPACSSGASRRPACAFCHLPIKGLGNACTVCNHRTHAKCFRTHFASSTRCPSCLCRCALEGGISGSHLTFVPPAPPTTTLTRGFSRPSITPPSAGSTGRMTYASLKTIREQDTANEAGALGFSPQGSEEVKSPTVSTEGGVGGWLGWDPRFAWAHHRGSIDNFDTDPSRPANVTPTPPLGATPTTAAGSASNSRPQSRDGDDPVATRGRIRQNSGVEGQKEGISALSGRMRLTAFRSGDSWTRQGKG